MKLIAKKFEELTTTELYEILKARAKIFIVEQNINFQDMDDIDYDSLHCFFMENNKVIAYIRAFYEDEENGIVRLGRALTIEHQKGYGKSLMEQSLKAVKEKMECKKIIGHSQEHALSFYEQFGFRAVSKPFIEEGIVHVAIELDV